MKRSDAIPGGRDLALLALILLLATVLRVIALDAPLWFDEITTVETHVNLPWGEMMRDYSMNHHYFFSLKSKLATEMFGAENWAYRLPAVLFGIATVAAIWWLARDIGGTAIAHISALLVALSYHQVWFSQNARGYTELAFWSTLGLIFFLRGTRHPSLAVWIGLGLAAAAAVFTHLTGAFFFVALGLVWLIALATGLGRTDLTRAWIAFPLIGVGLATVLLFAFYLPVLPSLIETVGGVAATSAVDPMQEYQNPLWTIFEGVRTAIGGTGPLTLIVGAGALVAVLLGAVAAHREAPLFSLIVVAHIAVTLAILLALNMRIWPRFFFIDIGLFIILIVLGCRYGAELVARWTRRPGLERGLFGLGVLLMVGVSVLLVGRNYSAPKQDFAGALALVEEVRGPSDRVLALGPSGVIFRHHYKADWDIVTDQAGYEDAMSAPGPVIVVVSFPARVFRLMPGLERDVADDLERIARFPGTLGDGDVLVYRRN
ncbi:MAG: glycosyltransferase family 39 protein [Silicimonas sp.]|nr:glycosyltransferase family 39 protein [Silicimonas sp.]